MGVPDVRVYVTGAAGSGVTTLGRALARVLDIAHVDCDDHYWMPTDPPYTTKRPAVARVPLIRAALGEAGWVLTGSFDGWGDPLIDRVDMIVFLSTPHAVRMARLADRERQRFGDRILPDGDMHGIHRSFMDWAAGYENPAFNGRNRARHEAWLAVQRAPLLRLDGDRPPDTLVAATRQALGALPGVAIHPRFSPKGRTAMDETEGWRHMKFAPRDGTRILVTVRASEQGAADVDVAHWARGDQFGAEGWRSADSHPGQIIGYAEPELKCWMPLPKAGSAARPTPWEEGEELFGSGI
jgi:adenylate kinase family enzyme